ncbi:MAG: hypothetical protein EOP88_01165 [Verrucomicrobiaceae bacterium]|nr:MAG: hypothetical protein EOP88_01165 [Verrucomicrobiaceae bacterium]
MKHHSLPQMARILTLALATTAVSGAATLINEGFEGGTNVFNLPTYAYTDGYTLTNTLSPTPGLRYAHGGNPAPGNNVAYTQTFSIPTLMLASFGFTTEQIDAGTVAFNIASQFSTYQGQNDHAVISLQFRDGSSQPLGSAFQIGGSAFVTALAGGTGNRDWGNATLEGFVPTGARELVVTLAETKTPQGAYIDGYVDNVRLDMNVVPEPGSAMLGLVGGLILLRRRK